MNYVQKQNKDGDTCNVSPDTTMRGTTPLCLRA